MRRSSAFTLVELLAVIAIIGIIAAFTVPAATRILSGSQLGQATSLVVGQLKYARQEALSQNKTIEVRFYKYIDPAAPGTTDAIRALQLWQTNSDGKRTAVGSIQRFPGIVVVGDDATITKLGTDQDSSGLAASEKPRSLPGSFKFKTVQFRPDGSTTLDTASQWFLTLKNENQPANPPANFATIQIQPLVGSVQVFRP